MPPAGEKEAKMSKEVLRGFNVRVPPAQLKLIAAWAAKQPVPPTMSEAIRRLAEIGIQNSTGVLHRILRVISETTHEKIGADPVLQRKIAERLKEVENELKVEPGSSDWLMIQQARVWFNQWQATDLQRLLQNPRPGSGR
jgi:hypothetical protein